MAKSDISEKPSADVWVRLSGRARPSSALATIENPATVGRLVAGTFVGAALLSGCTALLMFRYGEPEAASATFGLAVAYLAVWAWFLTTKQVLAPAAAAAGASVADLIAVHLILGGYAHSGGWLFWGIVLTFALVVMLGRREAVGFAAFYAVLGIVMAFVEPALGASRPPPDPTLRAVLFAAVLVGNLAMVTSVLSYFVRQLATERERSEKLLLNVLPAEVAAELKERGWVEARRFDCISVVFADIVGFTQRYAGTDPGEMVDQLNEIFTHFDTLTDKHGCEKIRTIGDAYMVAAGVPVARDDHAQAATAVALEMLDYAADGPVTFRIGINSGPVVAGVIGTSKFQYDVWGDTVNTASRMESHGEPGRIQISESTYRLIADDFVCTPRGLIEVKGKGELRTWFVDSRRTDRGPFKAGPP